MSDSTIPVLGAADLCQLARSAPATACPACAAIRAPGWEAMPAGLARDRLRRVGTLRQPQDEDPTLQEHHPHGTNGWAADAPIALSFFPYNRCEVWQCVGCGRPFLRYTEYGGYYVEERVRELAADRIVEAG